MGKIFYANTRRDAAAIGFDDDLIYRELARPISRRKIPMKQLLRREALKVFAEWKKNKAGQNPVLNIFSAQGWRGRRERWNCAFDAVLRPATVAPMSLAVNLLPAASKGKSPLAT